MNLSIKGPGAHNRGLKIIGKIFNLLVSNVSFVKQMSSQGLSVFSIFMILWKQNHDISKTKPLHLLLTNSLF